MMRKRNFLLGIIIVALSVLSLAGTGHRVTGHITPLPHEELSPPIHLSCGVVIEEWRGASPDAAARGKVRRLCNEAKAYFPEYVRRYNLRVTQAELDTFQWPFAMLPDNRGYRNLNDTKWRFWDRPYKGRVYAYTSHTDQYTFMMSNARDTEFSDTFVHEAYHAMSYQTGVFFQLPGDYDEKIAMDESMAQEFTRELGY